MKEIYTSMEFRKFFSEDIIVGPVTTTYLGQADYKQNSPYVIDGYAVPGDKARAIWKIKKIVVNDTTGITETFYPDANPE